MNREACVELGKIVKAHGMQGEMKVSLDVHDPQEYQGIPLLYLGQEGEALIPRVVTAFSTLSGTEALLSLEGVRGRLEAEALVGITLYYPTEMLPELPEGQYYFFEIVGFTVRDRLKGDIGTVREVRDLPGNDLLVVDHQQREVLIPMSEPILVNVDKAAKLIEVDLPEGLLELYLE